MRKFQLGDKARVAPERLPCYYPIGVRPGRIVTIKAVIPGHHGVKCYYRIGNNGKLQYSFIFRSDDLRPLESLLLRGKTSRPSGGPARAIQGVLA